MYFLKMIYMPTINNLKTKKVLLIHNYLLTHIFTFFTGIDSNDEMYEGNDYPEEESNS